MTSRSGAGRSDDGKSKERAVRGGHRFFAVIPGRAQREPGSASPTAKLVIQWYRRGARLDPRLRGDDERNVRGDDVERWARRPG